MRPVYQRADFPSYRACRKSHESRVIYPTLAAWTEALGYLLGVCLQRADLELHGGCLFLTHEHLDVGHPVDDDILVAPRYSKLWEEFHFLVWRLLRANQGWPHGPAYTRLERTHQGPVLDVDEFWRVICYDTAQAVAAGLFRRTSDYPGLVFLPEDVLTPRVFRRNHLIDRIDPERVEFELDEVSIQLGIPRLFTHLTREQYAAEFEQRLRAYESEVGPTRVHPVKKSIAHCNSLAIGKRLTLPDLLEKTRGHQPPHNFARGFPPFFASKTEVKLAFKQERREFWDKHKQAFRALNQNRSSVRFPAGTYGWRKRLNVPIDPPTTTAWVEQPTWWPD